MKASVKLRSEEHKSPLFHFKLPISILSFPFISAATAGDAGELALHLRNAAGPSVKLTYRPTPLPPSHPFSLTLKSGVGPWGSPHRSPLIISASVSLPALLGGGAPSFSLLLKPQIGDFSLSKIVASSSPDPPNPKLNGGGAHRSVSSRTGLEDFLSSGAAVSAVTMLPVSSRAAVKLRWGVNVSETAVSRWRRLPCLTVEKISVETVERREEEKVKKDGDGGEVEAMKGVCFWMKKEVEELRRESGAIKEGVEQIRRFASDWKEAEAVGRARKDDSKGNAASGSRRLS